MISEKKKKKFNINDYAELIETVSSVEYSRMTAKYLADFSEIKNIATQVIIKLCANAPEGKFNRAYLSTAISWAIRNEVRRRYKWYILKNKVDETLLNANPEEIREAVYKTVLSVEEMQDSEKPNVLKDGRPSVEESICLKELASACRAVIKTLSPRERDIIEAKFYRDKKLREIATEYDISISRVSRIIQTSLDKIKIDLQQRGLV